MRFWLLFCLSVAGLNAKPTQWTTRRKAQRRNSQDSHQVLSDSGTPTSSSTLSRRTLQTALRSVCERLVLRSPPLLYHMDRESDRLALIDAMWRGDFVTSIGRFTATNKDLVFLFENIVDDVLGHAPRMREKLSTIPRFEGVLSHLVRSRSQKRVPIEVAVLSVVFLLYSVPHFAWQAVAQLTRAIMSWSWTVNLCDDAVERDPGPMYATLTGLTGAVFDNFQMNIGYGSYATQESKARIFQMTNWASVFLPAATAPGGGVDIIAMLRTGGIFRNDLALSDFLDLFSPVSVELLSNKRRRWSQCLERAAAGTLWCKEAYASPYPPTMFHWHNPIFDRLQSSYEDVNFELDLMRSSNYHRYSHAIQIGGDGLSYMRLIHRLAQDPQRYLRTKPVIIPRLGARSVLYTETFTEICVARSIAICAIAVRFVADLSRVTTIPQSPSSTCR